MAGAVVARAIEAGMEAAGTGAVGGGGGGGGCRGGDQIDAGRGLGGVLVRNGCVLGWGAAGWGRLSAASSDKIETPMSDPLRDPHASYESPLASRNASAEMLRLFS